MVTLQKDSISLLVTSVVQFLAFAQYFRVQWFKKAFHRILVAILLFPLDHALETPAMLILYSMLNHSLATQNTWPLIQKDELRISFSYSLVVVLSCKTMKNLGVVICENIIMKILLSYSRVKFSYYKNFCAYSNLLPINHQQYQQCLGSN